MENSTGYQVNPRVRTKKTHDGRVLVTILGARIDDVQHLILENASAIMFWDIVSKKHYIEEVMKDLLSLYSDNCLPEIEQDLEDFIKTLFSARILTPLGRGENHG